MSRDDSTEHTTVEQPERSAKPIDTILIIAVVIILLGALIYGVLTVT